MIFGKTKTEKEKKLAQVSQYLDAFGDKIIDPKEYERYKLLIKEEATLQKDTMIEKMLTMTQYNQALKKGEMPVVAMPEMKFQNRSIRIELKVVPAEKVPAVKPTIIK